jgi:DNA (cytosine-5)-methyltransferase 1
VDLVVFGSPCQSFSVAGKRLGLDDPRGNMALVGLRVVGKLRPRWVVWENVPGVLSSDEGRDFGAFLGLLGELGYGFAYRVLDAQHAGVPQRRRRVFVVGYLGDWRPPAAVLFEPESLRGDSPPRREAGQGTPAKSLCSTDGALSAKDANAGVMPATAFQANAGRDFTADEDRSPPLRSQGNGSGTRGVAIAFDPQGGGKQTRLGASISGTGCLGVTKTPAIAHSLRADGFDASEDVTGRGTPLVAFQSSQSGVRLGEQHATLDSNNGSRRHHGALQGMSVRRLTPVECERLQGFPDGWTDVPYRGKPAADGNRYRAIGNSMAVPVVRWIGERILMFERGRR